MATINNIKHKGIIKSVENDVIKVTIQNVSACASCHAKGVCSVSDVKEKTIEIFNNKNSYSIGDEVNVLLQQSLGFKALFLGYVLPFIIVLITLIMALCVWVSMLIAGSDALKLLIAISVGSIIYFACAKIGKFEELKEIKGIASLIKRKT